MNAPRRVHSGFPNFVPKAHLDLLLSMQLVMLDGGNRPRLTDKGRQRVQEANIGTVPTAQAINPFDPS